jgi:ABC-type phosphate/phosphonate transport system permease subunit
LLGVFMLAALVWSVIGTEATFDSLRRALPNMSEFFHRLWPPDLTLETSEARPFSPPLRLAATAGCHAANQLLGTALARRARSFGLLRGRISLATGFIIR